MPVKQGDLGLLQHPASRELLASKIPARLAYIATDGTPRVVPMWFHWNGREIVMATPPKAPKLKALAKNPKVALTIDDTTFPHKVLMVRGSVRLESVQGIVPEYATAAERYFGAEMANGWLGQLRTIVSSMVRITLTPEWVGLLDFQTNVLPAADWRVFYVTGSKHTFLGDPLTGTVTNGTTLADFLTKQVTGDASWANVTP